MAVDRRSDIHCNGCGEAADSGFPGVFGCLLLFLERTAENHIYGSLRVRGGMSNEAVSATRHWDIELHCNKGLAGGAAQAIAATRSTAINPLAIDSFALAICAGGEGPSYPGIPGHEPHTAKARNRQDALKSANEELRKVVPTIGSYWSESDYFEKRWEHAFWGSHAERLMSIKRRYDPRGLFSVHHGIGS